MADHQIVIIGTGFSGLGMGIQLRKAGITDFVILEQNDDLGGTWHENHYPGCACDVQSALYSFSFEQKPDWSREFAPQAEIKAYLKHCAEKYGLLPHIRLNTHLATARYSEQDRHWQLQTCDSAAMWAYKAQKGLKPGDPVDPADPDLPAMASLNAQVVVAGVGGLSTPAYPDIPGLETFTGKQFHSQNWDHHYDLTGKRVAVIGTGASAIQFVPQIAKQAARIDLYQRTPPWIVPKPDKRLSDRRKSLFQRYPALMKSYRSLIYWLLEVRALGFVGHPKILKLAEGIAHRHIRNQIDDPHLRQQVTPDFHFGCKRVLISNDYYPALARDHVQLITDGIASVNGSAVVDQQGEKRDVDCLIYGTGFRAQEPMPRGLIFGRGGQDLLDTWTEGAEAYKGTTVAGFPNLFILMGPNTGLGHNSMVYMIESQIRYVMGALEAMKQNNWQALDVRTNEQQVYNQELQGRLENTVWQTGCRSWYLNENGRNTTLWPGYTWRFRQRTRRFDPSAYNAE